jgi:hypothetical protein
MVSVSDTHYKQRAVIEFLVAEKESVGNIHKWLCAVCGSCAVDRSTVERWVQKVKASGSGETELHNQPRSGSPVTATMSTSTFNIPTCVYKPIKWSLSLSFSLLFEFKGSKYFVNHLPIFRRHYTNAVLVSIVCGCRCGLFSGWVEALLISRTAHNYNRTQHLQKLRLCSAYWRWASDARNMSRL